MPFNLISASISFLAGLVMAIMFLFKGQPVTALVPFVCGLVLGTGFFFGILRSLASEVYQAAIGIAMLLGVFAVCYSSDLFKPKLQRGYAAVLPLILDMDAYCPLKARETKQIKDYGLKACALQNNSDISGAVAELGKGIHFGPGLTLVDSAATLAADEKPVNHCARAFKAADRLCPIAFSSIGKEEREALLTAAQ